MKAEKKNRNIVMWASIIVVLLALCGCTERPEESGNDVGRLSLNSLYSADAPHKIRFNTKKKDDMSDAYEMVSRKWNMDFLLAAEQSGAKPNLGV